MHQYYYIFPSTPGQRIKDNEPLPVTRPVNPAFRRERSAITRAGVAI